MENQATENNPERVNPLALVERPDQADGLHPFTVAVIRAPLPENKMLLTMEKYNGATNPEKYLQSFVDAMVVYSFDDLVWCRDFS